MSARRKMLAADEDIANKIVEVAKRRGSTVYQTVNDILEQALRVDGMGLALSEVIDTREKLEKAKNMGLTFTIERLLYEMMDIAHEQVEEKADELWLETGRWYGKYFSSKNSDAVKAFEEAMELLTLGNPVFIVERQDGGKLSVSCVGEQFTAGSTQMYDLFIQGAFETFGWELVKRDNSKGIVRLLFQEPR
jgi:hypothetical protein